MSVTESLFPPAILRFGREPVETQIVAGNGAHPESGELREDGEVASADDTILAEIRDRKRFDHAIQKVSLLEGDVGRALEWAVDVSAWAPLPGSGNTSTLWELLASTAAVDVAVARVLEPHLDAHAILDQAGLSAELADIDADAQSTWGVFAAEGPGMKVVATRSRSDWILDGTKPWCSLARHLSHALVTAHVGDTRQLFAVDLRQDCVSADSGPWFPRGLPQVVSAPVHFSSARAIPVGEAGWYLTRSGFQWGGMGVAACWWGGAVGVARSLYEWARRAEPDQLALSLLGAVDTDLNSARSVLRAAAAGVDDPSQLTTATALAALRLRNLVADVVDSTLLRVGHARGPGPLVNDEAHARRVADLQLYVRQHHAGHDQAALGRVLVASKETSW